MVRYKDKTFSEERFFGADSTVFDIFTFPFVAGNPKTALIQPNTIVITASIAISISVMRTRSAKS